MNLYVLFAVLCAIPVFVRALCIVTRTTRQGWPRWRHLGFAVGASLMGVGAVAVPLQRPWAVLALLAGLAAVIVFDRRRHRHRRAGG
ncbi:hypothetical protein [Methyloversatilis sp.]|uniref:hypothetical protein n=1 Tax=Methyloversatilis sp. TaxID=2569862 RepID=UPI003D28B9DC